MKLSAYLSGLIRTGAFWVPFGLGGIGTLAFAEEANPGPIVELPKFVVTDSRELPPPESWRYVSLPGIEVLSSASDRTTRRLVQDFQMFREALDVVWPMPATLNTPMLLVLCNRAREFDSFRPAKSEDGPDLIAASLYLRNPLRGAIVVNLGSSVVNVAALDISLDEMLGTNSTQLSIDHNKQLYREYVRYMLSRADPRLPAWFEEGMAQIVMGMEFNPKWIEFGKIEEAGTVSAQAGMVASMNAMAAQQMAASGSAAGESADSGLLPGAPAEDRDFNNALARRALMPMDRLFALSHEAVEAQNPLGNNVWAKQCYAFVHMCLFGEHGKWRKPFSAFLLRSTREPVTEALFKECFKMSYKDMAMQLRGYIQFTAYEAQIYRAKDRSSFLTTAKVELRDATPAEIGRIKGNTKQLAGRTEDARTELIAPYIRGDRDPQLLAALGLIEHAAGKPDRARRFLTAAVAGKCSDPEAYLQLARYLYADALAAPGAKDNRFSPEQVQAITQPLLAGRVLPPPMAASYELLAETLLRSGTPPTEEQLVPLVQGVQIFSHRLKLVYQTATLCRDAGLDEVAHRLTDFGVKNGRDEASRSNFQRLKASLRPLPTPPAAGSGPANAPTATPTSAPTAATTK
ncbi:hypothetical protein [Opitutus sp. ER46]|uniref:tetratricopeptide repeat protein n=1 Tax=Opitutus sp. ER46 TaxID=2161864 RepID=UPI0011B26896|nr:hypothetical protein [Opitutus sp. ER46]